MPPPFLSFASSAGRYFCVSGKSLNFPSVLGRTSMTNLVGGARNVYHVAGGGEIEIEMNCEEAGGALRE